MADLQSVKVALRVRPLVPSEQTRGCQIAVEKTNGENQVLVKNNRTAAFSFDFVFDGRDSQELVYNASVSHTLDKLFNGFNVTILAYGQTGSGKTHTMGTAFDGTSMDQNVGVIPRAMHDIFKRIKELNDEFDFVVKCSFMELYQEQLFDLMSEESREKSLVDMREDHNGIVMVGLTEKEVQSAKETTDCLVKGSAGRAVASTAMNQASSRSHAIFTVTIQATKKDETRAVTTSKFHLVDLAGSERPKKTGATGDRFKEGVKINQGLLALGNVIAALGEGKRGAGFVRYRDSKLTRLLQNSLGGNSVTLMIACVSPADYNVAETLSTLRYADRARKIKNKPIMNQDPQAAEIKRLNGIIKKLRQELLSKGDAANDLGKMVGDSVSAEPPLKCIMPLEYQKLQEKYRNLQQQCEITLQIAIEHKIKARIAEAAYEKIKRKADEMKIIVGELSQIKESPKPDEEKLSDTVTQITKFIKGLDDALTRAETELMQHKRRSTLSVKTIEPNESVNNKDKNMTEMNSIMQERTTEAFKGQQNKIKFNSDLEEKLSCAETELMQHKQPSSLAVSTTKPNESDDNKDKNMTEMNSIMQERTTEAFKWQQNKIKFNSDLEETLSRAETELMQHKQTSSLAVSTTKPDESDDNKVNNMTEMNSVMQERTAVAFKSQQSEINEELQRLNLQLQLQQLVTLENGIEKVENSELLDKLRHVNKNASAKLAEERRKRVQALEHEMSEMKRRNTQQAKMLKIKEQETQKIINLRKEIQAIKESKVKLIRDMRSETENFRKLKMMHEKELIQVRGKELKMLNEMSRKEVLHNKKCNVLKRKCEEAMLSSKRLKDALERQKVAQTEREKMQSVKNATVASNKISQIIACFERELDSSRQVVKPFHN